MRRAFGMLFIVASLLQACPAAEFNFKAQTQVSGSLLRLGDVADIRGAGDEYQALARLELMPAPASGSRRTLQAREVEDVLALRGIDLTEHTFGGAKQIVVSGNAVTASKTAKKTLLSPLSRANAEKRITSAIRDYFLELPQGGERLVSVALSSDQAEAILSARELVIQGDGKLPGPGKQALTVQCTQPSGNVVNLKVQAQVTLPPSIVVAARPLPRGTVLRLDDLRLQTGQSPISSNAVLVSLEEAIGKEITHSMTEGQPLEPTAVKAPAMVKRNQIVKVFSLAQGIRVETRGRAREEGAEGELISIETIATREPFTAKVSGDGQVEVYAHAMQLPAKKVASNEN